MSYDSLSWYRKELAQAQKQRDDWRATSAQLQAENTELRNEVTALTEKLRELEQRVWNNA